MSDPEFFKERGINQGLPRGRRRSINPPASSGLLAIIVSFTDHPSQVAASYFDNLVFGSTGNTVNDFYSEVSYGTLDIVTVNLPSTVGWHTMPQTYAYYVNGDHGFGDYPQNAQKLTEDAVWAVNSSRRFLALRQRRRWHCRCSFRHPHRTGGRIFRQRQRYLVARLVMRARSLCRRCLG